MASGSGSYDGSTRGETSSGTGVTIDFDKIAEIQRKRVTCVVYADGNAEDFDE